MKKESIFLSITFLFLLFNLVACDSDSRFYTVGTSVTVTCVSSISSINLDVGINCVKEANVKSCSVAVTGNSKTFTLSSYSCSTLPCSGSFHVAKVTATCPGAESPSFSAGGIYAVVGPSGTSNFHNLNVGDSVSIKCVSSIQSVTIKAGTNCPSDSQLLTCNLVKILKFFFFF